MLKRFIPILVVAFMLSACGAGKDVYLKNAENAKKAASYEEAVENYEAMNKDTHSTYYHAGRADIDFHFGYYGRAVNNYTRALRISGRTEHHLQRGRAYMKLHFYKDAIYDFTAVIETKGSTFPVAYVERAKAYMEMGDYQKAVKDLDKALKRGGSSQEFNVAAADLYFRLGKYDSAKPYIQKAIMGNPHDAELYFLRAKLFYKTKDANQAVKDLKKSFTIDPNHNESKRQLAWIYSTNPLSKYRDAEKAVEIAEELYGKNQDVDYAEVLAAAYAEAGEYQKAVNVLKENMNKTDNLVVRDDFRVFMKFYNEKKNIRTW